MSETHSDSRKRPGKKSRSSIDAILKPAGIVGWVITLLALFAVGGYSTFRHFWGMSKLYTGDHWSIDSIDLAWIPEGVDSVSLYRPQQIFDNRLINLLSPGTNLAGDSMEAREISQDLDLVMIPALGRAEMGSVERDSRMVMVLHFQTSMDARSRFKELIPVEEWQSSNLNGKTYWRIPEGSPTPFMEIKLLQTGNFFLSPIRPDRTQYSMYAPNGQTIVLAREVALKKALTQPYVSTPLRELVRKCDLRYDAIVADICKTEDAGPSDPMRFMRVFAPLSKDSLQLKESSFKSITLGLSSSAPNLLQMVIEANDREAASTAESELQHAKTKLDQQLTEAMASTPANLANLSRKVLDGVKIEKTDLTVKLTLKQPENFISEVTTALKPFLERPGQRLTAGLMGMPNFSSQILARRHDRVAGMRGRVGSGAPNRDGTTSPANPTPGSPSSGKSNSANQPEVTSPSPSGNQSPGNSSPGAQPPSTPRSGDQPLVASGGRPGRVGPLGFGRTPRSAGGGRSGVGRGGDANPGVGLADRKDGIPDPNSGAANISPQPQAPAIPAHGNFGPTIPVPGMPQPFQLPNGVKSELAGGDGGGTFQHFIGGGSGVAGVEWRPGSWAGTNVIGSILPVGSGGIPRAGFQRVTAPAGYVLGGINVYAPKFVCNVQLVYMKLRENGTLDPKDTKLSEWLGGKPQGEFTKISGNGKRVIGLHGRGAAVVDAIGLILEP